MNLYEEVIESMQYVYCLSHSMDIPKFLSSDSKNVILDVLFYLCLDTPTRAHTSQGKLQHSPPKKSSTPNGRKSPGKAAAACNQNQDLQRLSHSIEQLNDSMHIVNTLCAEEKKNRSEKESATEMRVCWKL
jgi:hypothetical protein